MANIHAATDKAPVILDIGYAYTRAGFAGDDQPLCVSPSKLQNLQGERWLRDIDDPSEMKAVLRDFLRHIYLKQLLVSMNERAVIVCESVLCTDRWRHTLARVLFDDFCVPSVVFAPKHLLALYTLGVTSAMVLHCGYTESLALPVYENMVLLNAWQSVPLAGKVIEDNIEDLLITRAKVTSDGKKTRLSDFPYKLTRRQLEDIKVRTCFVTRHNRATVLRQVRIQEQGVEVAEFTRAPEPVPDVNYPLTGDCVLTIPGRIREEACEVLYDQDSEHTLAHIVLDSLLRCPIDSRKVLAENIVLIGGTCMLSGFKHRLQQELHDLSSQHPYKDKIAVTRFAFHDPPARPNYVAWLGGSILGSCANLDSYAVTKAQFQAQGGCIPDWSSFNPTDEKQLARLI